MKAPDIRREYALAGAAPPHRVFARDAGAELVGTSDGAWVEELYPAPAAEDVFRRFASLPHCLFLDSARRDEQLGRYSFVMADPFEYFESSSRSEAGDPIGDVERRMAEFQSAAISDLPPFQGGAAGLISYDYGRRLERLPAPRCDEFEVPSLAIGLYDVVVAFDHFADRAWIISQGFPEREGRARRRRARERSLQFRAWLDRPPHDVASPQNVFPTTAEKEVSPADLSPQYAVPDRYRTDHRLTGQDSGVRLTSNFSPQQYVEMVARGIEYIRAGDLFQVNLAQRLLCPAADDSISLYLRLRQRNPAPLAGYFDLGDFQILSASPERFLRLSDRRVEARPIKGTRRRTARPEADLFAGDDLRQSEKDNAENVMIVDLLRNDLARVCRPESVLVSELCRLEVYEFVQHLVSIVHGELAEGQTAFDLLRAAFPGGSITGAPKIRAMEVIAELEPTARGAYCGGLGFLGFDGSMDMNILIRTITAGRGWWQMPVGGGIVAQSDPQREYEETWHKAEGLLRAIRP